MYSIWSKEIFKYCYVISNSMIKNFISMIIVNYNGKNLLKEAIDSVKKSVKKSIVNAEIILLDNASTDGSVEFVRKKYPDVRIVKNKVNMAYSGINTALPFCNGNYILFLNNDISMDNKCIKNLFDIIKGDKDIFQVCPSFINYHNKKLKSGGTWVSRAFYSGHIPATKNHEVIEVPYLGMGMVRREVIDYFGYLFDPDYFIYAEDLDLGLRVRLMGKKTVFVPDAIIYHIHSATMQSVEDAKKTFLLERNLMVTMFKILSFRNVCKFLPYAIAVRLIAILKNIASGNFAIAYARIRALFWIIFNFNLILEKRIHIQKLRKIDDNYILKIFTEKYIFTKRFLV